MAGNDGRLATDSGASLVSLQRQPFAACATAKATLTSIGDYNVCGGGPMGTGRVNTPSCDDAKNLAHRGSIAIGSRSRVAGREGELLLLCGDLSRGRALACP